MNARAFSTLAVAVLGLLAAGCAGSRTNQATIAERTCVRVPAITSFAPLDDQHVLVTEGANDQYLLTVDRACGGLTHARGITFGGSLSNVCGDGTGWLAFDHPGIGARRCRILWIEEVEDEAAARALIGSRRIE